MSIGISFLELDRDENYLVVFKLVDAIGNEVATSNGMEGIPSHEIDPQWNTSYLSASFYFPVLSYGTYKFTCNLISLLYEYGEPIDTKEILFNVINGEAISE